MVLSGNQFQEFIDVDLIGGTRPASKRMGTTTTCD